MQRPSKAQAYASVVQEDDVDAIPTEEVLESGNDGMRSEMLPETMACTLTARPKTRNVMTIASFVVTTEPERRAFLADTDTILVLLCVVIGCDISEAGTVERFKAGAAVCYCC